MVLPGTFMPFFFPLGIAFMGSQSAVMMKMAGEQWQYGKRRISAMTNDEFNKLTPQKLFEIETQELRAMIPLMKESMADMNKLTPIIVTEMVNMFKSFAEGLIRATQESADTALHPFFNQILEFFGLPTKNLGDFSNTPDKFQPPTYVAPLNVETKVDTRSYVLASSATDEVLGLSKDTATAKKQRELLLIYEAISATNRRLANFRRIAGTSGAPSNIQAKINKEKLQQAKNANALKRFFRMNPKMKF